MLSCYFLVLFVFFLPVLALVGTGAADAVVNITVPIPFSLTHCLTITFHTMAFCVQLSGCYVAVIVYCYNMY